MVKERGKRKKKDETDELQSTLNKISSLLAIGLGEAGAAIIVKNL